jgi:hypothetical protein
LEAGAALVGSSTGLAELAREDRRGGMGSRGNMAGVAQIEAKYKLDRSHEL